ncbi:hypothetical protein H5410_020896 [Solanum commersonii]|uniref:Uncharacterized protein n=1 Tax=Solanum commersonii TaxID=4109 RepID=A0A9J5ZCF8_SOLCO|nr:hypothetical protein H5410_020896 [Solanum commersonii]
MSIAKNLWQFAKRTNSSLCSSMRSPEGRRSKMRSKEQSTLRRIVPRSSTISPNSPEREDVVGKHLTAMRQKKDE